MNTIMRLMFVSMLMILAAPAYSAQAVHMFACEQDDDATEEQLEAAASKWLKAARTMKGGEQLEAYIYYPLAVRMVGAGDLVFVIVAPSIEQWGVFWDGYKDSPAEQVDNESRELVVCPDSGLWELVKVK